LYGMLSPPHGTEPKQTYRTMTTNTSLAPTFSTAAALATALNKLAIANSVFTKRAGDKWSTEKLNIAKNEVRLAHFHNTMGGAFLNGGFDGVKESQIVKEGFAAAEEASW
jgi:hypothetical protein